MVRMLVLFLLLPKNECKTETEKRGVSTPSKPAVGKREGKRA